MLGNLLQNIIKASLAEFIFSKIPCFQNILLLNTLKLMCLNYENCSLRPIKKIRTQKGRPDNYKIFKKVVKESATNIILEDIIRSNLPVAQNGRFVICLVYPGGGTMVAKILGFELSESLKMRSPGYFALSNYP